MGGRKKKSAVAFHSIPRIHMFRLSPPAKTPILKTIAQKDAVIQLCQPHFLPIPEVISKERGVKKKGSYCQKMRAAMNKTRGELSERFKELFSPFFFFPFFFLLPFHIASLQKPHSHLSCVLPSRISISINIKYKSVKHGSASFLQMADGEVPRGPPQRRLSRWPSYWRDQCSGDGSVQR